MLNEKGQNKHLLLTQLRHFVSDYNDFIHDASNELIFSAVIPIQLWQTHYLTHRIMSLLNDLFAVFSVEVFLYVDKKKFFVQQIISVFFVCEFMKSRTHDNLFSAVFSFSIRLFEMHHSSYVFSEYSLNTSHVKK